MIENSARAEIFEITEGYQASFFFNTMTENRTASISFIKTFSSHADALAWCQAVAKLLSGCDMTTDTWIRVGNIKIYSLKEDHLPEPPNEGGA